MNLARAIHFDESDTLVFHNPARTGEWAVSGGFEFSNWSQGDLVGKARQAFANGWLGLETFGRVTFVAVTKLETSEYQLLIELCEGHDPNTLLSVVRELSDTGVAEAFRVIAPPKPGWIFWLFMASWSRNSYKLPPPRALR